MVTHCQNGRVASGDFKGMNGMQARWCSSHKPARGLGPLLGLVFVLVRGRVAWAQWADKPSLNSPSNRLDRDFGRLRSRLGAPTQAFTVSRDPANVASLSADSVSRNWGRGRRRASETGIARPRVGGGRMIGRRSGYGGV